MSRWITRTAVPVLLAVLLGVANLQATQFVTGSTGPGSAYAFAVPENWNEELIIYGHGIIDPGAPVVLPTTQDGFEGIRDAWGGRCRRRAGAGPALHRATFTAPHAGVDVRKNMLGWAAQAGLAFFDGKRLFSEIAARYHGMGTVALRDDRVTGQSIMAQPSPMVVLPDTDVTYSHWSIGISLGVKLQ